MFYQISFFLVQGTIETSPQISYHNDDDTTR